MKYLYLTILLFVTLSSVGQITIGLDDMPVANDSIKLSTADNGDIYNYSQTGANHYWDYSELTSTSYTYDSYVEVGETNILYTFLFNPFVANLAANRPDFTLFSMLGISLTNGYTFYKKGSQEFKEVGFGTEVNGLPIPVTYSSPDVIYEFPLTYNKTYSSNSAYQLAVPSMGYLGQTKNRTSVVDGWGTIVTPFGKFKCLRVVSYVQQEDSVSIDALPLPIPTIPSSYTEYTWLSNDQHLPILKVTEGGLLGTEVTYIDSTKFFPELAEPDSELQLRVYPNPSTDFIVIETNQINYDIDLVSMSGDIIWARDDYSKARIVIPIHQFAAGVYFIKLQSEYFSESTKIIIH